MTVATRVGLLDAGAGPVLHSRIEVARDFVTAAAADTAAAHGERMASIIATLAPAARLLDARVFDAHGPASANVVAEGLEWLVCGGARLVNLSFGLRQDRKRLREACADALAAGVVLVAASPARGAPVYPARYEGVVAVTGDARCAPGEYAWLAGAQAVFGACVGDMAHRPHAPGGGASCAAAHVTGALAALHCDGVAGVDLVGALRDRCRFRGAEQRRPGTG